MDIDSNSIWKYFCDQTCMHDFIRTHKKNSCAVAPKTEALETPIEDPVKETTHTKSILVILIQIQK